MDINEFIYQNFFLKFWFIYIYGIILGIVSSYFVSYEGKYSLTLFTENKLPIINIIFLNISTFIFGIRSGLHNYIRHTMYIKTVDYFFKNICLQKLEYWDKYITDADLLKCMLTDITIFINVCSRTFSLILKSAITSFFISLTLLHTNTYYFILAIFLCTIRSLILEKYSKKWEDYNYKVNNIKQELESHLSDFIKNNISFQLCGVERTYVHIIDHLCCYLIL
jgi:ABC-type multidrug transport system fused ATPase/permease subunit